MQGLERLVARLIDAERGGGADSIGDSMSVFRPAVPRPLIETLKTVHNTKWKLIKMRQVSKVLTCTALCRSLVHLGFVNVL